MWIARLGILLSAGFAINACGGGGKTLDWQQEVPLHDGRVLVVERLSKVGASDPFLGGLSMELEQTLAFKHPDSGDRIEWRIPEGLQPAMIDFDHGIPYYVLRAYTVSDYNKWDCPNPPFLVYRYEQGGWKRISFGQLPITFSKRNLFPMFKDSPLKSSGGRATVRQLENYWRRFPDSKVAMEISREKVNANVQGCFPSVLERLGRANEITESYGKGNLK